MAIFSEAKISRTPYRWLQGLGLRISCISTWVARIAETMGLDPNQMLADAKKAGSEREYENILGQPPAGLDRQEAEGFINWTRKFAKSPCDLPLINTDQFCSL